MTRRAVFAVAVLLLAGRPGLAQEHTDAGAVPRMTLEEFRQAFEKKQVIPVDVRGQDAYRAGHIAGARLASSGDDLKAQAKELKKAGKTVVTYCA